MWNLAEPELLPIEPLCGTSTFTNGTFMWNLSELELLRMEPLCETARNLAEPGARFRAAAPNHHEALLEEPQAFQAVGEKHFKKKKLRNCFASQVMMLFPGGSWYRPWGPQGNASVPFADRSSGKTFRRGGETGATFLLLGFREGVFLPQSTQKKKNKETKETTTPSLAKNLPILGHG